MKQNNTAPAAGGPLWASLAITIGLLGVAAGTLIPLLLNGFGSHVYVWVYGAGALLSLVGRLFVRKPKGDIILRRLYRVETWTSVFFCAAAVFMYLRTAPRDWIALTLAGGILMLYTSIRIPREIRKQSTKNQ